ncbi:MAG: ATP-binding protein [Treponema sp.]|nr:ATP-binding protein [Treponema sp.]
MTIFKKSLITLGSAVMIFSAVFIVSVMIFMNSLYYDVNMAGLKNTAQTLMTSIGVDKLNDFFLNMDEPSAEINFPFSVGSAYRLTLVASNGYVLWDSHVADRLVNHNDREEIAAALGGREGMSRRDSISTGMRQIYYAMPVLGNNNNVLGVFRLSFTIPEFGTRISPIIIPFVIFICFFIIAAFWVIVLYSRSLSASLVRLVNIAKSSSLLLSLSDEDLHVVPEFVSLEKAMRAMAEELNWRFEQAKSESSRLEAILNGMSEAVFAVDSSLKLRLVNPKARKLFNIDESKINSMTLLDAARSTELVKIAQKAISDRTQLETELTFHSGLYAGNLAAGSQANTEQFFKVFASVLISNDKLIDGVVLVLQEITQLVKLERIRKDFVANVSHELRTPIQLIKGFSETLSDAISDNEITDIKKISHFIEIIRKNAGTMENLTNDLLVLSSLENNAVNARDMEESDIAPLVNEAVSAVDNHAKRKQIEVIIDCNDDLKAKLYSSFIVQALINLIDNGVKYSPEKSKIWVNAYKAQDADTLVFEVRDKGMGIPAEHQERIFERFYRVDRARSREAGGTGLGLSIVRHIALLHKGSVEAESRSGEGSVFRIKIPCCL